MMEGFKGEEENLVCDSTVYGKPVKRSKDRCDMVILPGADNILSSHVRDCLKGSDCTQRDTTQESVICVEPGSNKSVN